MRHCLMLEFVAIGYWMIKKLQLKPSCIGRETLPAKRLLSTAAAFSSTWLFVNSPSCARKEHRGIQRVDKKAARTLSLSAA